MWKGSCGWRLRTSGSDTRGLPVGDHFKPLRGRHSSSGPSTEAGVRVDPTQWTSVRGLRCQMRRNPHLAIMQPPLPCLFGACLLPAAANSCSYPRKCPEHSLKCAEFLSTQAQVLGRPPLNRILQRVVGLRSVARGTAQVAKETRWDTG